MPNGKHCQLVLSVSVATCHTWPMDTTTRFVELVAAVLRERADAMGVSGAELARRSGVSQAQISRIFTGQRSASVDHVIALSEALGSRGSHIIAEAERRLAAEAEARSTEALPAPAALPSPRRPVFAEDESLPEGWETRLAARRVADSPEAREAAFYTSLGEEPQVGPEDYAG